MKQKVNITIQQNKILHTVVKVKKKQNAQPIIVWV